MEVDYIVLADAAAALNGKHYIHGGGWDTILASAFPMTQALMSLAVRLRVPWAETNQPHELLLDVVDGDGASLLPQPGAVHGTINVGRPAQLAPGSDQVLPLAFDLRGVPFAAPGDYAVVVRLDGQDAARARFTVRANPASGSGASPAAQA